MFFSAHTTRLLACLVTVWRIIASSNACFVAQEMHAADTNEVSSCEPTESLPLTKSGQLAPKSCVSVPETHDSTTNYLGNPELPSDIHTHLTIFLDLESLTKMSRTNKHLENIVSLLGPKFENYKKRILEAQWQRGAKIAEKNYGRNANMRVQYNFYDLVCSCDMSLLEAHFSKNFRENWTAVYVQGYHVAKFLEFHEGAEFILNNAKVPEETFQNGKLRYILDIDLLLTAVRFFSTEDFRAFIGEGLFLACPSDLWAKAFVEAIYYGKGESIFGVLRQTALIDRNFCLQYSIETFHDLSFLVFLCNSYDPSIDTSVIDTFFSIALELGKHDLLFEAFATLPFIHDHFAVTQQKADVIPHEWDISPGCIFAILRQCKDIRNYASLLRYFTKKRIREFGAALYCQDFPMLPTYYIEALPEHAEAVSKSLTFLDVFLDLYCQSEPEKENFKAAYIQYSN